MRKSKLWAFKNIVFVHNQIITPYLWRSLYAVFICFFSPSKTVAQKIFKCCSATGFPWFSIQAGPSSVRLKKCIHIANVFIIYKDFYLGHGSYVLQTLEIFRFSFGISWSMSSTSLLLISRSKYSLIINTFSSVTALGRYRGIQIGHITSNLCPTAILFQRMLGTLGQTWLNVLCFFLNVAIKAFVVQLGSVRILALNAFLINEK